jgi:hypothetical protein
MNPNEMTPEEFVAHIEAQCPSWKCSYKKQMQIISNFLCQGGTATETLLKIAVFVLLTNRANKLAA